MFIILLLCLQCESRSEPLGTQCTEPQDLSEYQKMQVMQEEDQWNVVANSPQDKQPLIDIKINKEDNAEHVTHSLLPDSSSLKEFGEDISCLSSNLMPRPNYRNESELPEAEIVMATLIPQQFMEQDVENTTAKAEISEVANKMDEIVSGTSGELCDNSSSTLQPDENPLLPKGDIEQKLTKSHRQIIEKIRSYYEAAEAVAEDGQVSRRNSFSNIPTGLVKDSVSRFNFFVHQVSVCDSESGRSDSNENDIPSTSPTVPDQNAKTFSQPDYTGIDATVAHNNQEQCKTESKSDDDEQICDFKPCMELWKEKERKASGLQERSKASACKEGRFSEDKEACEKDPLSTTNKRTPVPNEQLSPEQDCNENIKLKSPEQTDKTIKETQSTAVPRDKTYPNDNLDGLPSQIKVGRLSRHGKAAVTCSRTLYEGIADVSSIGFFETAPMDQCLVENSEKILSKVQMLAQMYMAKSSSMKVPLHQKRTRFTKGPCKVNTPLKSQIMLHQADVKTQNHPSGETLFLCLRFQTMHNCFLFHFTVCFLI